MSPSPKTSQGPPEALHNLAAVDYSEAEILLQLDPDDVERYFRRKGVPSIGRALAVHGISGSSIHMLSANDIETKLDLNLGQQLALKGFIRQMQAVNRNSRRVETVWSCEEAEDDEQDSWKSGCCCCPWLCCYCCCCRPAESKEPKEMVVTPKKAVYTLTNSELSIEEWSWVDNSLQDKEVVLKKVPNLGCGCCCGYTMEPIPQQCTSTNNIDLSCIEDVDNRKYTAVKADKNPTCMEFCCGYTETHITPAATITVTFVDKGNIGGIRRVQKDLRVSPEAMSDITRKIIAEKDANAETLNNGGHLDHYNSASSQSDIM